MAVRSNIYLTVRLAALIPSSVIILTTCLTCTAQNILVCWHLQSLHFQLVRRQTLAVNRLENRIHAAFLIIILL